MGAQWRWVGLCGVIAAGCGESGHNPEDLHDAGGLDGSAVDAPLEAGPASDASMTSEAEAARPVDSSMCVMSSVDGSCVDIKPCAGNCSGHGACQSGACTCDTGYTGAACADCASGWSRGSDGTCQAAQCMGKVCNAQQTCNPATGQCCACLLGASRCTGGSLSTCSTDPSGCGVWGPPVSCGSAGCDGTSRCAATSGITYDQWGTASDDNASGIVSTRPGQVYVAGDVGGFIDGLTGAGGSDLYLRARGSEANWTRIWGTKDQESAYGLTTDGAGAFYVAGMTTGKLGATAFGNLDGTLSKLTTKSAPDWTTQWGGDSIDTAASIVRDPTSGALFVAGRKFGDLGTGTNSSNIALTRIDPSGAIAWSIQWGTEQEDLVSRVVADGHGDLLVVGLYGTRRGFISKVKASGSVEWTKEYGNGATSIVDAVVLANGDLLLCGWGGAINPEGTGQAFVARVSATAEPIWSKAFGASPDDAANFLLLNSDGTFFVAGVTAGALVPGMNNRMTDVFVQKRDTTGGVLWTKQLGTDQGELIYAFAQSTDGTLYVAGLTNGSFPGFLNAGAADAFLATIKP